jgi:hypothetical protein
MAQSILVFDFGTNEEAAQQGRHKVDAWQQGFRLGKKILLKFDRKDSNGESVAATGEAEEAAAKSASAGDGKAAVGVRLLIRLDFSDHEKLTLQRWLDRIPSEEPFKSAKGETIRHGDAAFAATAKLFDSLD